MIVFHKCLKPISLRAKIMLVGDANVGKTTLASVLAKKWIPEQRKCPMGTSHVNEASNNGNASLNPLNINSINNSASTANIVSSGIPSANNLTNNSPNNINGIDKPLSTDGIDISTFQFEITV